MLKILIRQLNPLLQPRASLNGTPRFQETFNRWRGIARSPQKAAGDYFGGTSADPVLDRLDETKIDWNSDVKDEQHGAKG